MPYPGHHWQPRGQPARYPHEYIRNGTAKQLTLFHPATGEVRVKGVRQTTNAVLHPWLKSELKSILSTLPKPIRNPDPVENRRTWERWQAGLSFPMPLPEQLPPLRMLLVLDNLQGHRTPELVQWLMQHGVMPLYTPVGGSWLNMAESIQAILKRRALDGAAPQSPDDIIDWIEATARGWNRDPTPFIWGGKRKARRTRARERRHRIGGSGACAERVVRRRRAA